MEGLRAVRGPMGYSIDRRWIESYIEREVYGVWKYGQYRNKRRRSVDDLALPTSRRLVGNARLSPRPLAEVIIGGQWLIQVVC